MKTDNFIPTVSFVFNNQITEINFSNSQLKPTTTVLEFLRGLPDRKGTKEGCAEGDCGACTVVLGVLQNASPDEAMRRRGKMNYQAWDSCLLFLPMLHGKWLITVEDIGCSENMHPVQQAMVDCDGSQCGYCTPGFIMSLFSLYMNNPKPGKEVIKDALTGNLCRCTGYRPIIDAALKAYQKNRTDAFSIKENASISLLKKINNSACLAITKENISGEKFSQHYYRPSSLADALYLRSKFNSAVIINGATDIALHVTKKKEHLREIIDISNVNELQLIDYEKDRLILGAGVCLERVKALVEKDFPAFYDMLAVFGSLQIRNAATLGGNLANASPIGDTLPVLMAYEATVILANRSSERSLKVIDFITGYRTTMMKPDELITKIIIPELRKDAVVKAYKISRRKDLDISSVSGGFRLAMNSNNIVSDICLAFGGMAAMVKRAKKTEQYIKGKEWSRKVVDKAMYILGEEFSPVSDARAGEEGRKIMAGNLLMKFWTDTGKHINGKHV